MAALPLCYNNNAMLNNKIEVKIADIVTAKTDAVVCSSNKSLLKGSGLSKFIYEAAGQKLVEDEASVYAPLEEGTACFTSGFNLPARYIIHTAVPNLYNLRLKEGYEQRFSFCYVSILKLAEELNARTLAVPPLGVGHYGWPLGKMVQICLDTVCWYFINHKGSKIEKLVLVCREQKQLNAYNSYLYSREFHDKFRGLQ